MSLSSLIQTIVDASHDIFKTSLAVTGATIAWFTLSKVVAAITAVYVLTQFLYLVRKWYCEEQERAHARRFPPLPRS